MPPADYYAVDPKRIFATGISNGAMMSYRLACELSDKIAAVAPVEGAQNVDCWPSNRISVIVFHGTADRLVPFDGGTTRFQIGPKRTDNSVANAVEFSVRQDGCSATSTAQRNHGTPDGRLCGIQRRHRRRALRDQRQPSYVARHPNERQRRPRDRDHVVLLCAAPEAVRSSHRIDFRNRLAGAKFLATLANGYRIGGERSWACSSDG